MIEKILNKILKSLELLAKQAAAQATALRELDERVAKLEEENGQNIQTPR